MKIKLYDLVELKDGRKGVVIDIRGDGKMFTVDIGDDIETYDTIDVKIDAIAKVII